MGDVGDGENVLRRRLGKVPNQVLISRTDPVWQRECKGTRESEESSNTRSPTSMVKPSSIQGPDLRGVSPVQDVSRDDAMGSTKPGAKLREENVGANSQQESLLLYEAITTSIKGQPSKK